jgi:DNA-binding NarL/FixJ family response regulator
VYRSIPTIFLTAFPDDSERRCAMRGGAVEYLGNTKVLLKSIRAALNRNKYDAIT